MTVPTPPIGFDRAVGELSQRYSPCVTVDDSLVQQLERTGARIDSDIEARVDAGRDWWPLAMTWALAGETPTLPAVVARPADAAQVSAIVALCSERGVPVTAVAGRSGVCGGSLAVFGGVALDLCGLRGIVAVDDESLLVDVRAGTFGIDLENELRSGHGLTLGHWPQSIDLSTVGGWLACRSAGQYSTRYGKIEDMVRGLEVVLASGECIRTGGRGPRQSAGPDLTQLFVGSEGTLGIITEARFCAHPVAPAEHRSAFLFAGDDSFIRGLDTCRHILRRGATPAVLRLYDERESKRSYGIDGGSLMIVLDEGEPAIIDAVAAVVTEECAAAGAQSEDVALVHQWLEHRNDVSALETVVRQGIVVDTAEISARWSALGPIYRDVCAAAHEVDGLYVISAHQSHAYTDGACLYFTFAGQSPAGDGDTFYRQVWDAVTQTTLAHGGSLSHHHGVGLNRGRFMSDALGPAFDALVAVKGALDPAGILNPGKLGLPSPFGEVPAV